MIKKLIDWTKNNKLATVIIFILILTFLLKDNGYYRPFMANVKYGTDAVSPPFSGGGRGGVGIAYEQSGFYPQPIPTTPNLGITDRKVVTNASMSLQVSNVKEVIDATETKVSELGGYVVNVYLDRPEFGESATVSVRVPSDKVNDFLAFARESAVKVVNENISGTDVTDQFVDYETHLAQLEEQRAMLEEILRKAVTVEDIMKVRPYLSEVQNEIDMIKGQLKYLDESAKASLVTMYLATDELSLPYTPELSWRPEAIFKNASRSLLVNTQKLGTGLIWLAVYSAVIVPALTIVYIVYLVKRKRQR